MSAPGQDPSQSASQNAFGFVQQLATELSQGRVHLPGIPEVAMRVHRLLNDENVNVNVVVQAVNAEPTLALQIMRMANSAALSAGAAQVTDVRAAVLRVGTKMIRAAALSFLVRQLKGVEELKPLRERLSALWQLGVAVGVTGRSLAQKVDGVSPDSALLAGLLHVIGRLYILTRLNRSPQLMQQPEVAEKIMVEWSGNIARVLLENWEMPGEYCDAVANYDDPLRDTKGPLGLTDVLAGANALAGLLPSALSAGEPDSQLLAKIHQASAPLWSRLGLSDQDLRDAVHSAARDAMEFRSLFSA